MQVHIAQRHLLPKLLSEHGLSAGQLAFPREVMEAVASGWTREAGVRRLSQARFQPALLLLPGRKPRLSSMKQTSKPGAQS